MNNEEILTLLKLLLDHNAITFIGCPSCPTVHYCSPSCQEADKIHPLECKHFSSLETLSDLSHITARLLFLVAGDKVEPEKLPFGQGTRGFWDLLSHAEQIPDDDYWSVKIFEQVGKNFSAAHLFTNFQKCKNDVICTSCQKCSLTKFYQTGSISLKSMDVFLLTVLRSV